MYTSAALLDMHERGHRALGKLLEHCTAFSPEELHRPLEGFGYQTLQLQLHHLLEGEAYWIGVVQGAFSVEDNPQAYPDLSSLMAYQQQVAAATAGYLSQASEDELNTVRPMTVWGGGARELMPARVFLRTLTHIHHHIGQSLAMCRLLGRPGDGMDFPII